MGNEIPVGFDAKRAFHNDRGIGNYSRRFIGAFASQMATTPMFLYTPKYKEPHAYGKKVVQNPFLKIEVPHGPLNNALGGALWRSRRMVRDLKRDGIGIYYGLSNELPSGIGSLPLKKVVIIHDLIFLRYPDMYPWLDRQFYRRKTRQACEIADLILTPSGQSKDDVVEFYGVDSDKIEVVHPPCAEVFYEPTTPAKWEAVRAKYQLPEKYFLSVGAIVERKNLLGVVKAMVELVQKGEDAHLVVVGKAPGRSKGYLQEINSLISEVGLEDRIHFRDQVPNSDLPVILQHATSLLFPSFFEGFGMPIVEALASHTPVITSRGGCFPEAGGPGAVYIDPKQPIAMANAMRTLLHHSKKREELITAGWEHAQQFRLKEMGLRIREIHESLLNPNP